MGVQLIGPSPAGTWYFQVIDGFIKGFLEYSLFKFSKFIRKRAIVAGALN